MYLLHVFLYYRMIETLLGCYDKVKSSVIKKCGQSGGKHVLFNFSFSLLGVCSIPLTI